MIFTQLRPTPQQRLVTDAFTGYDHRLSIPDGAFYHTENLSLRDYPLLATRRSRGLVRTLRDPGGILDKDALCTVEDGTLYVNHHPTALTGLAPGEKQLVSMGACLCVFPDKQYYNTEDPADFGCMEAELEVSGELRCSLCDLDGNALPAPSVGETEPEEPANGALWIDTAGGRTLRCWSEAQSLWVEQTTVYTRLDLPCRGELPRLFKQWDGVSVSGAPADCLNGEKLIYALGGGGDENDYLVLVGLLDGPLSQTGTVRISRTVPDLDFVCQCQNRLWGCRYGFDGEKTVNELYCCALGDFKNWRQYAGLSTDSWTASVGSDGPWTGAVSYLGHPCFFKENRIHSITVSATGAHRVEETVCRGVQKGSHKSLQVVGESLYYKSPGDVCVWQGGFPQSISAALGDERYRDAAAGAVDVCYDLSRRGGEGWSLFVYDPLRSLWVRQDSLHALGFAASGGELYCIDADSGDLLALKGTAGTIEGSFPWMAETGILHYRTGDRKYVSRYNLSLRMAPGARLSVFLRYDSDRDWQEAGAVTMAGTGTVTLPIRPRRCDHLQLRLAGEGEMKLYALTQVLETGSDM